MAGFAAVATAAKSIERLLTTCFDADGIDELRPVPGKTTTARLVRTEDLVKHANGQLSFPRPALTIFTYRLDFNKSVRAAWAGAGTLDGRGHVPLDLHFLLTPWADNSEHEHRILGKAIECLESTPLLSGPLLVTDPATAWAANEVVQVVMEEVATEAVMRTFDTLPTDYKVSVPYIARVIRVDARRAFPDPTATEVVRGLRPAGGA